MLIDGLRDDFVFGSKGVKFMPYTTYLVEKGASHSFVAEAKLPTVTMPRIKVNSLTKCVVSGGLALCTPLLGVPIVTRKKLVECYPPGWGSKMLTKLTR